MGTVAEWFGDLASSQKLSSRYRRSKVLTFTTTRWNFYRSESTNILSK